MKSKKKFKKQVESEAAALDNTLRDISQQIKDIVNLTAIDEGLEYQEKNKNVTELKQLVEGN